MRAAFQVDPNDVEAARFANSLMDKMLANAQIVDGKAVLAMTPGIFWEAFTENGYCWICQKQSCVVHSKAIQRAAFEAEIEQMQPLTMSFAGVPATGEPPTGEEE